MAIAAVACGPAFVPITANIPEEEVPPGIGLHYITSNENRLDLFYPYIRNQGGIFLSVGTDQNLTLMSWAQSTGGILIDRDAFAVLTNRLHVYALKSSLTYAAFRDFWSDAARVKAAARLTQPSISDTDLSHFMDLVGHPRGIAYRLRRLENIAQKTGVENFTVSAKLFNHLKHMAAANAILVLRGDLTGHTTMPKLAAQLKLAHLPVSLVYLSNIEDYPMDTGALRRNLGNFAMNDEALLLRTLNRLDGVPYSFPEGEEFAATQPFHYNMQRLIDFVQCGLPRLGKEVKGLQEIVRGVSRIQCGKDLPH